MIERCALAALTLAACVAPSDAVLLCHNANCAAGASAPADDTIDALRASLALRTRSGRVVFDGIELDTVWDRTRSACVFAHAPHADAVALADAVDRVTAHVARAAPDAAGHGSTFYLKLELKVDVGEGASHTPEEILAHVRCVTAAARQVVAAGVASRNRVIPIYDSDDPALLAAIAGAQLARAVDSPCLFETGWAAPLPPGFAPQILTVDWREATLDAVRAARTALGHTERGGVALWSRSPAPEALYEMLALHPAYLSVNNVEEARGILDEVTP